MIQATELRIGNWVKVGDIESTVCLIDHNKFIQLQGNAVVNRPEQIEPIPLTPEILEKFGFEESYKSSYTHSFDFKQNTCFGAGWNLVNNHFHIRYKGEQFTNIKYLHQLQNLYFALTSEELIINF